MKSRKLWACLDCFILTFEPIEYCLRSVSIVLEQIALNLLHKYFSSGRTCKSILKLYRKYSHSLSLPLYLSLSLLFFFLMFALLILWLLSSLATSCRIYVQHLLHIRHVGREINRLHFLFLFGCSEKKLLPRHIIY